MSSYSRNSRKPSQALHLAFAAALLAGSAAHAADEQQTFVLTAFSNVAGGQSIVTGDYDAAVKELASRSRTLVLDDSSSLSTNRCVAYSVTKQLDAAYSACDAAISEAREEIANLPVLMSWARREYREYLALAYSNRAVLNWLSNNSTAAQDDLNKAKAVAPSADFVAHNLSALQNRNTVARVSVVSKS